MQTTYLEYLDILINLETEKMTKIKLNGQGKSTTYYKQQGIVEGLSDAKELFELVQKEHQGVE